jgi:hypothetical protein
MFSLLESDFSPVDKETTDSGQQLGDEIDGLAAEIRPTPECF